MDPVNDRDAKIQEVVDACPENPCLGPDDAAPRRLPAAGSADLAAGRTDLDKPIQ
jgi:hypothetical protein